MRVGSEAINLYLRRVVLAGCGALLLAGAVGTAGATAARLPRSPAELGVGAGGLKVKPRSIVFTGDGTGLLAGPNLKSKAFGWSPPSRSGYCVDTQGQKPAAGCANIATLP